MAKTIKRSPAVSPEARENEMIALAMDQVEQQLREGRASSQVLTHFLKLATMREQLEKAKLEKEIELLKVKAESIEMAKENSELYQKAFAAFSSYNGFIHEEEVIDDDEY